MIRIGTLVYASSDITDAAISAIQELGFSYIPSTPEPTFSECKSAEEKNKDANFKLFWTDYLPLNDAMLKTLGIQWDQLNIIPDGDTVYQFRLVGCYYTANDPMWYVAVSAYAHEPLVEYGMLRTRVNVTLRVDMQFRGRRSSFVDAPASISPKPIADAVGQKMNSMSHM